MNPSLGASSRGGGANLVRCAEGVSEWALLLTWRHVHLDAANPDEPQSQPRTLPPPLPCPPYTLPRTLPPLPCPASSFHPAASISLAFLIPFFSPCRPVLDLVPPSTLPPRFPLPSLHPTPHPAASVCLVFLTPFHLPCRLPLPCLPSLPLTLPPLPCLTFSFLTPCRLVFPSSFYLAASYFLTPCHRFRPFTLALLRLTSPCRFASPCHSSLLLCTQPLRCLSLFAPCRLF